MTNREICYHILRKYPEIRYNRADFFWKYLEEYHEVKFFITKKKFYEFMTEFAGLERELREVLKENEFKLKPECDQKRYEKADKFKLNYSKKEL